MAKMGRPTTYSFDIALEFCKRISNDEFVVDICKDPLMPAYGTVNQWLSKHNDFAEIYARAKNEFFDRMARQMVALADSSNMPDVTNAQVQATRLQIDTRKWLLAKLRPSRYGDKVEVDHTGNVQVTSITRKVIDPLTFENNVSNATQKLLESKSVSDAAESELNYQEFKDE